METASQKITNELSSLNSEISDFLLNHSKVVQKVFPWDNLFFSSGDHGFEALSSVAVSVQDKLFKKFNLLSQIIEVILVGSIEKHLNEFKSSKSSISANISQNSYTWHKNVQEVIVNTNNEFDNIIKIISELYPNSQKEAILIPDTNALYANTDIENWEFEEFSKFKIALTPSVLSDLDRHKIEHRQQSVKDKATLLIRKIKEFRRRGKLTEGVTVRKDKISLFTIATEPDFNKTLPWLDRENDDDRLIAETLEIIRKYGEHAVILITADINLQNKCEVANLVFCEPPMPN